jgi:hypothetical protein
VQRLRYTKSAVRRQQVRKQTRPLVRAASTRAPCDRHCRCCIAVVITSPHATRQAPSLSWKPARVVSLSHSVMSAAGRPLFDSRSSDPMLASRTRSQRITTSHSL